MPADRRAARSQARQVNAIVDRCIEQVGEPADGALRERSTLRRVGGGRGFSRGRGIQLVRRRAEIHGKILKHCFGPVAPASIPRTTIRLSALTLGAKAIARWCRALCDRRRLRSRSPSDGLGPSCQLRDIRSAGFRNAGRPVGALGSRSRPKDSSSIVAPHPILRRPIPDRCHAPRFLPIG